MSDRIWTPTRPNAEIWRTVARSLSVMSTFLVKPFLSKETKTPALPVVDRSPFPIHLLNWNGAFLQVSDGWLTLFGYARQDVIGMHITKFQNELHDIWLTERTRIVANESATTDTDIIHKDLSVLSVTQSAQMEVNTNGDTVFLCSILSAKPKGPKPQTVARTPNETLNYTQKMDSIGQLTGGIAHDFNNMLQSIGGCLDAIEHPTRRPLDISGNIRIARRSLTRAADLTQKMLAFARRQSLYPRCVEIDSLISGVKTLVQPIVGTDVAVDFSSDCHRKTMVCDPNQMERTLIDLVTNAKEAMPHGGRITISVSEHTISNDDIQSHENAKPGDYIEITVSDNGVGMPEWVAVRAFEPFFTTKCIGQGSGLGLSQVYGFVQQSGGIVRIESLVDGGTTVRLMFPVCDVATPLFQNVVPPPLSCNGTPTTAKKILVVEDEEDVRVFVTEALMDMGYTVIEAADGNAGLRVIQREDDLDIIVSDVGLPGINGRQLADAARIHRPGIPILLMTGYAGTALDDLDLDADLSVLHKPFPMEHLTSWVQARVNAASA